MAKQVWNSEVSIWRKDYLPARWINYDFSVIGSGLINAYEKIQSAIRRKFGPCRYKINSIERLTEID